MKNFNHLKYWIFGIISFFLLSSCKSNKPMINSETVKQFDIEKYLGTWYEIARYPHSFEKDLVGVTASYSWREDGKIKVENKGFEKTLDGDLSIAIGKAKIPDKNDPSKLKVSFFWIFYGDYYVLELDDNYQWAVIGTGSPKYLWILSRTPIMDEGIYQILLEKIKNRGYDLKPLIKVEQTP